MAKRITLADLARHTGLSVATISMALNGRPGSRIPPATVSRVKEVADELGYMPNQSAKALRSGVTGTIGFISDEVTTTRFASPMITGILDKAEELGYAVMMMETGHRTDRFEDALGSLRERNVDGIVIGVMASRSFSLPDVSVPLVVVNGISEGHLSILPDETQAGADAVRHLVANGHTRIALIGRHEAPPNPRVSVNIPVRMAGIDSAMADARLTFVDEFHGNVWEPELGYEGARAILGRGSAPTAILAANDRIAFGVYLALGEAGIHIGDDISVLSFDDEDLAAMVRPGLTTLRLPYRDMGEAGAAALIGQLAGGSAADGLGSAAEDRYSADPRETDTKLPLELIERDSVKNLR